MKGTQKFTQSDIKIVEKKTCYSGFSKLEELTLQHKLFSGEWSPPIKREVFGKRSVAALLPYDPIRDEVVLIQQFRVGALTADNPWLLEIVAGICEPDESIEELIVRETFEEAGLKPLELLKIYEYWVSPGGSCEHLTLFCGRVDASNAGGIHGLKQENEDIQVITVPANEAIKAISTGEINNAASIIALQWLALNKDAVFRN
ncbi:MAG: NUDIX domain-containing protein [Pseudomonadota bacterium]|nr:NUDIX domain-containing protein [Pseudomonadota bacterium]